MGCFDLLKEQLNTLCPKLDVRAGEPLERHTSFHIGGPAALMAFPATQEEAVLCVRTASKLGIEPFFMGNGSNLLAADRGVDRFLIKTSNLRGCKAEGNVITADSGITLARLAVFAREQVVDHLLDGDVTARFQRCQEPCHPVGAGWRDVLVAHDAEAVWREHQVE